MKRKPRDYSMESDKPVDPRHITINELANLSLEEMLIRANGELNKEDYVKLQATKSANRIRVRQDVKNH